jgi:hypothetical protein
MSIQGGKYLLKRVSIIVGVSFVLGIACTVVWSQATSVKLLGSLVVVRNVSEYLPGDDVKNQGALVLYDTSKKTHNVIELGYYRYGSGLYSSELFEFYTSGISVRNQNGTGEPFLAVRDEGDIVDIRLRHDGTEGIIGTRGTQYIDGGNIRVLTVRFAKHPDSSEGLFVDDSGALYYRGPNGTVTKLAEP